MLLLLAEQTTSLTRWPGEMGAVAWFIVAPILIMMGVGFLIQRWLGLDMPTLTRLNFYLVVPAMVYFAVVSSELSLGNVGVVVGFTLLAMAIWSAAALLLAAWRGVPHEQWRAMVMTAILYNSGNYGLPLQELAFRPQNRGDDAMGLQVFVMLVQNLSGFTLGVLLAAGRMGGGMWKRNLLHILKFPPIYALAAALLTIAIRQTLPGPAEQIGAVLQPIWDSVLYAKDGFFAIALATLGAQLANVQRGGQRYPVTSSVILRLLGGPAVGLLLIWLLGLDGFTAQVLLISTAMPTSVNCVLLCLQFDNHPDFVARSVFYSTVLSPITVTLTILLTRSGLI